MKTRGPPRSGGRARQKELGLLSDLRTKMPRYLAAAVVLDWLAQEGPLLPFAATGFGNLERVCLFFFFPPGS